jgi:pimeloyl-ACP methyl ester carboxylesterase
MTQDWKHRLIEFNGTRIHAVEAGEGPLVILVHGFPELWYSWRYQIPVVADAGYRALAIDQRGYGSSSKYWRTDSYRIRHMVDDLVGLVHALGETSAILIGHDWGAPVVWTAAWRHPEIFAGVLGMSVPFSGRGQIALPGNPFGERSPHEIHRAISGPGLDFYQEYFSGLGPVIDEIEGDLRGWVRDLTWTVSGDAAISMGLSFDDDDPLSFIRASALCLPPGTKMRDRFITPEKMPAWFTDEDLDIFADALQRGGLSGPLSYYHNLDNNWHDLADIADRKLTCPAMYIGAEYDVGTWWGKEAIARAPERISNWMGSHIISGAGHWLQQEKAEETNRLMSLFLRALRPGS